MSEHAEFQDITLYCMRMFSLNIRCLVGQSVILIKCYFFVPVSVFTRAAFGMREDGKLWLFSFLDTES